MATRQPSVTRVRAALDEQLAALGDAPHAGQDDLASLRLGCLSAVLRAIDEHREPMPAAARVAVRLLLDRLAYVAPGHAVEVRIPPYAVVQCVEGPRHTRGTPPAVVEMTPLTWLELGTGRTTWAVALSDGRIQASGNRADLSPYLPLDAG